MPPIPEKVIVIIIVMSKGISLKIEETYGGRILVVVDHQS
jgi:hypothetical protein